MLATRHHNEWLNLIEVSGPFLTTPVLQRVFPQGLDSQDTDVRKRLAVAYEEWRDEPDGALHDAWIRFVLRELLELPEELLARDSALPTGLSAALPEHGETLRPDMALLGPEGGPPRLLVCCHPAKQPLEHVVEKRRWLASPLTRALELLKATGVALGLVTNGEEWCLVYAPPRETTSYATWRADLWGEEPITLRAFQTLLRARRFFGVAAADTLEAMLVESAQNQHEVTDQLGLQVRRAIEVLVNTLDRADQDRGRALLRDVSEQTLYEAALTVMMRLIFLLCAEERDLLPLTDEVYEQHYAVSTIIDQLRDAAARSGEEVLERRHDAWCRLLAAFRAVHGGILHDRLRLMAYGGHLFDPDRYPFLEGRPGGTHWREAEANPLPVDNRTVLHLLEALQYLEVKAGGAREARRLSFRALDVEQIGHVYEGLLDHTARRAPEPMVGLHCNQGRQADVPLTELEEWRGAGDERLLVRLREQTGRQETTLRKALQASVDAAREHRLQAACSNDRMLLDRVLPFALLLRENSRGYPVLVPPGGFYVTNGTDRRSTGTHYTPRSLTEPIVRYALEPLLYDGPADGRPPEAWQLKPARDILDLKVCDMAMGSGAFLVQACRYLSERLVEAWEEVERAHPGCPGITPEGLPSQGTPQETLIPADTEERLAYARRLVADRCLYGVDKNPMAVEMAKLSLWLVTLQKDRPFTFLDHALKAGDSLLGVTQPEQVRAFHLDPSQRLLIAEAQLEPVCDKALRRAVDLRRQLEAIETLDIRDTEEKERLDAQARYELRQLRLFADLIVGDTLSAVSKSAAAVDQRLANDATLALEVVNPDLPEDERARRTETLEKWAQARLNGRRPFHWALEFPEVFGLHVPVERRGFDAIVGNPPFLGGQRITGTLGTDYRDYLVHCVADGQRGSADLCAYFFLQARRVLRKGGVFGLLATNTIAQGDTREVGLEPLVDRHACDVIRAVPSRKWPGTANLEVAHVWIRHGGWRGQRVLDEAPVSGISPFLAEPGKASGKPYRLAENAGKSFIGSYVLGMGFVLSPEEAQELLRKDPRNADVLFPYLNGEDLNSRPDQSPSRWVINFHDWPLERAEEYPDCMRIVREKVQPERDRNNRKVYRDRWWHYAEKRPELYATIAPLERVLVTAEVSKFVCVSFTSPRIVFSHTLIVFPLPSDDSFSALQSSVHELWARHLGSTLETRFRYTPSDCFDTFPLPQPDNCLSQSGEAYSLHRAGELLARNEGLTKLYNRLHDRHEQASGIRMLRDLQARLDQSIAAAYGWTDLDLGHGFHETKQGVRFTISEPARHEVLDRLLAINHERHREEEHLGHSGSPPNRRRGKVARSGLTESIMR